MECRSIARALTPPPPAPSLPSQAYTIPAAILWALLAGAVAFDATRTRRAAARAGGAPPVGARLHTAVGLVIGLYALSALASVLAGTAGAGAWGSVTTYASIFIEDSAEASFIFLLLAIAAGYGIVRAPVLASLPARRKVVAVPAVYFGTSLLVDLAEEAVERRSGGGEEAGAGAGLGSAVFNASEVVSILALLLAWLFIFDLISRAREELEGPGEGIVGAARPAAVASGPAAGGGGIVVTGAAVPLPPAAAAAVAAGEADPASLYSRLHGGGAGDTATGDVSAPPTSIADAVARAGKVRLLRRFRAGVTGFVCLRVVAIVLPLLLLSEPGEEAAAVTGVLVAEGLVRLAFLAALAAIFRPVPDSPYLLLDEGLGGGGYEGGGGGGVEAGLGGGGGAGTARADASLSTELGVLGPAGAPPPRRGPLDAAPPPRHTTTRLASGPRSGDAPAATAPAAAPSPDPRFVLDDGGGDGWESGGGDDRPPGPPRTKRLDSTEEVPL